MHQKGNTKNLHEGKVHINEPKSQIKWDIQEARTRSKKNPIN